MSNDLLIYGMKGSPFVRKVLVLLAEKQVPFDFEMANPFAVEDWFKAISPAKRIPVLRDRSIAVEGVEGTIPDSSAICAYVERKHPRPSMYPQDDFAYARALWLEEYADSELAMRVGLGLFRPVVMARMFGREPDLERARKTVLTDLPPLFDHLERVIAGREFFVGDSFGIADIAIATQFVNFQHAGATLDAQRWPELTAFLQRTHTRPSFAACIAAEREIIPESRLPF